MKCPARDGLARSGSTRGPSPPRRRGLGCASTEPTTEGPMRTLISGGTIVNADASTPADVLVDGERIALIGSGLEVTADRTIDASGKWVIPGAIDVHTHMELPFGGTFAKDTFETGTRAAAFGGTTTIIDFAVQGKGQALREGLDAWHAKAGSPSTPTRPTRPPAARRSWRARRRTGSSAWRRSPGCRCTSSASR